MAVKENMVHDEEGGLTLEEYTKDTSEYSELGFLTSPHVRDFLEKMVDKYGIENLDGKKWLTAYPCESSSGDYKYVFSIKIKFKS